MPSLCNTPFVSVVCPPPPPPPDETLILENTLVVAENGDDATGDRNDWKKPYLTIGAAVTDAMAGDAIVIFPGTYIANSAITAGVNVYCHCGVTVNVDIGVNGFIGNNSSLFGNGTFNFSTGRLIGKSGSEISYVNAESVSVSSLGLFDLQNYAGTCNVKIKNLQYIAGSGNTLQLDDGKFFIEIDNLTGQSTNNWLSIIKQSGNQNQISIKFKRVFLLSSTGSFIVVTGSGNAYLQVTGDYIGIFGGILGLEFSGTGSTVSRNIVDANFFSSNRLIQIQMPGTTESYFFNGTFQSGASDATPIFLIAGQTELRMTGAIIKTTTGTVFSTNPPYAVFPGSIILGPIAIIGGTTSLSGSGHIRSAEIRYSGGIGALTINPLSSI